MPLPTDPLLSQQWHLINPNPALLDLNVAGVWNPTEGPAYTGAGVWTVVIDDGFDYNHSDIAPNYHQELDFDFEGANDLDPFGLSTDAHGTAVTGIIGAAANGTGAVGVAFDTELVGYRVEGLISDTWLTSIAEAIAAAAVNAAGDVVNISQGIANDLSSEFGNGYTAARFDDIEAAINTAVDTGRGGLGTIIVKSAGNSRGSSVGASNDYDVNVDDWTNDTRQVVVAAVNQDGFVSSYSSYGAAVLVSGFGTPGEVVTTDRTGSAGYDPGDFTSSFNGTSSAAPMVTGVVALMLEANEGLGWRDVQSILAASARHVGSAIGSTHTGSEFFDWGFNAADNWNGGGMHFSNDYGYGLVDALAAVRMAETWLIGNAAQTSGDEFTNTIDLLNTATVIPDGNATGTTFTGNAAFPDVVERVTVQVTFSTTFTGDMRIFLTSPDGTTSTLVSNQGSGLDFNGSWTFESQAFRGERADGIWSVRIVDAFGGDVLTVSDIVVTTFGSASHNDRYVYTDEYSDYFGVGNHVNAVNDTNGGTDTVNASAVTGNSTIRLDGGAGAIDGIMTTFSNVENAIGGDGNDQIIGNASANTLLGMRGSDTLDGGAGADTMRGGTNNDLYFVDDAGDVVDETGGDGNDTISTTLGTYTIVSNTAIENLVGTNAAGQTLSGNSGANQINGAGGNDALNGDGGSDTLEGGNGNDTLDGGTGNDVMRGGAGDDTYIVGEAGDVVDETGGGGSDTVRVSLASYSISTDTAIEDLVGTNAAGQTLTGNSGANNVLGAGGSDVLSGWAGNDTLEGGNGNDTLNGGTGDDVMRGGAGDDTYIVGEAGDVVDETGGSGTDTVRVSLASYAISTNTAIENLIGINAAGQTLTGNSGANRISGSTGNDVLSGWAGNDTLLGNDGNDTLIGGAGDDLMRGGVGDDTYIVTDAGDVVDETGGSGTDTVRILVGNYSIAVATGVENMIGLDTGGQTLTGNGGDNRITGATGNDSLIGSSGNDTLIGGEGNDTLNGGTGDDRMSGGLGDDTYFVVDAGDVVDEAGGGGTDTVRVSLASFSIAANADIENIVGISASGQTLTGNNGINRINGAAGNDSLLGSGGNDTMIGNDGNDTLNGGTNNDSLIGGTGDDSLIGWTGRDTLTGGDGADAFVFANPLAAANSDTITDFNVAEDQIQLQNSVFTALIEGALPASAFVIGTAATNALQHVIYNQVTGNIFYDADGNGAQAAVVFANIGAGVALDASHFLVI